MGNASEISRVLAVIDGQNLFHSAKRAFGYDIPIYGIPDLPIEICKSLELPEPRVRFYTGVPPFSKLSIYWYEKLRYMRERGVVTHELHTLLVDGKQREKGIDGQILLDVQEMTFNNTYDILFIFSQDNRGFGKLVRNVKLIAESQKRRIEIYSAYPEGEQHKNSKGIFDTQWIPINQKLYDACAEPEFLTRHLRSRS